MNKIFIKVLGCGASVGCPIPGCKCEVCLSQNPKNNRTRTSIYIRYRDDHILIDCGPDIRSQMLKANIAYFDYIFLTHKHLDHIAGIDDLRISFFNRDVDSNYMKANIVPLPDKKQMELFTNLETIDHCLGSFSYMFHEIKFQNFKINSKDLTCFSHLNKYLAEHEGNVDHIHNKPLLGRVIENFDTTVLPNGLIVQNYEQQHGKIKSLGYMIGRFAYSTDVKFLSERSLEILKNAKLKLFVISLTHFDGNDAHASLEEVKKIVEYIKPERVVLTHMSHKVNYEINDMLSDNMEFGYDGMEFEVVI